MKRRRYRCTTPLVVATIACFHPHVQAQEAGAKDSLVAPGGPENDDGISEADRIKLRKRYGSELCKQSDIPYSVTPEKYDKNLDRIRRP